MQNCWEYKNCGRQAGGHAVGERGICPAATETKADGINAGTNAGRACWAVAGSFCKGEVQGTFAQKLMDCGSCEFSHKVMKEQGPGFESINSIFAKLKPMPEHKDSSTAVEEPIAL